MNSCANKGTSREVLLKYKQPYSFRQLLDHLQPRALPGVEKVDGDTFTRVTSSNGVPGICHVEDAADGLHLRIRTTSQNDDHLASDLERLRFLFAIDEDPSLAVAHLSRDPFIGQLIAQRPWVRVPRCWDPFETSIRIIIGQQISVKAATTISGRIAANYGTKVSTGCDLNLVFPSAEVLANTDLSDVGLTERRKTTIRTFARSVLEGSIDFETPKDLQDIERSWCDLPGIGPWTAQVAAMRVLGHNDAMPASDLGILRSVNNIVKQELSSAELQNQSKVWSPFRSWAAQHLWQAPQGDRNSQ